MSLDQLRTIYEAIDHGDMPFDLFTQLVDENDTTQDILTLFKNSTVH